MKKILFSLIKSPYFITGLFLKLAISPFFGSFYLKAYFIPFIDSAILHLGANPWSLNPPEFFPYGSFLFALIFIPKFFGFLLFGSSALGSSALSLFLVKLPVLLLDIGVMVLLIKSAEGRLKEPLFYYWLNPILLFISYVYGQLDAVSMSLCFASLFFIAQNRIAIGAVLFAFATLSKFHVVILLPFICAFLWSRFYRLHASGLISLFVGIWGGISTIGFLPQLGSSRLFYVTVASPEAQRVFSLSVPLSASTRLYFGVAIVLLVIGRLCLSVRISERGLLLGAASIFGSLLLVTFPFPGWYYWTFPFLSLFFCWYFNFPRILYYAFQLAYFLHFGSEYFFSKELYNFSSGFTLTFLQVTVLGNLILMWYTSLAKEAPLSGRLKPLTIGISGDSGVGKSLLSHSLALTFNESNTVMIEGDDYHRWERGHKEWSKHTHLDPQANHLLSMTNHLLELVRGKPVRKVSYDHATGKFTSSFEIKPSRVVIIQGLHTLYIKSLRERLDLKVFIDADPMVRLSWVLQRDAEERGHSKEQILKRLEARRQDSENHILPQKNYADWIVEYLPKEKISQEEVLAGKSIDIIVRHTLWNEIDVYPLFEVLKTVPGFHVNLGFNSKELNRIFLECHGDISAEAARTIAFKSFPALRLLTKGKREPVWESGLKGVNQLVSLLLVNHVIEKNTYA